ncbi:MAG TPA: NADH-quinone oxidoreductase subunit J, partial [Ktedonobacterales bacterium]|nr:NADH-quinone oxidoreductase subunit J [Ktedonobacterales bacterium]
MSGASGWIEWGIFGALALIAVVTAASMILTMSMYRAGLALMSSFVALAGIFVLLNADMLAAIQIMMNVGGMLIMILFMVMLMMDPGGEMMWEMKRSMRMRGLGALSMRPPKGPPPPEDTPIRHDSHTTQEGEPQAQTPTIYTCPMHAEVRQPTPGACPKCGMTLVPADNQSATAYDSAARMNPAAPVARAEAPVAQAPTTIYTCPMHPEVRQSSPGQCPKCGMTLVPATDIAPPATHHDDALASGHEEHAKPSEHADNGEHANVGMGGMEVGDMEMGGPDAGARHTDHNAHSGLAPRQNYQMMVDMAMSTAQTPLALALGALAAALLIAIVILTPWTSSSRIPTGDASAPVGVLLLGRYMVGFEGAAFLILAGITASVMFARREPHAAPQSAT